MRRKSSVFTFVLLFVALGAVPADAQHFPYAQDDPALERMIEMGTTDNKVMELLDVLTNRFGGRYTGSDSYNAAAEWALWQFQQWGVRARLELVGEVPVGFNRGPWFGKMTKPREEALYFGTPSHTAGTKGVQRGHVVIGPETVAEVEAMSDRINGAWVLIPGESRGFARDGRRRSRMNALHTAMWEAGALGTIQSSPERMPMMDGQVASWDDLPVLPDIKLVERQYNEIHALVRDGQEVELEFDIRNWFRMGPVQYHNVVAWIPGSVYPDEYVIMSGHLDAFDSATGAVDCGQGLTVGMEALRLIAKSGARPKRTVMTILFAAEEMGIVGAQAWTRANAEKLDNIAVLMNRDHSPGAIYRASVPPNWYDDFVKIAKPLENLNPRWPFEVTVRQGYARRATRPGGTDASAFQMEWVPTLGFRQDTEHVYGRTWHTLLDTYNEVVPYTEHQQHTALATAVIAYGIANLDHLLPREGFYAPPDTTAAEMAAVGNSRFDLGFPLYDSGQPANQSSILETVTAGSAAALIQNASKYQGDVSVVGTGEFPLEVTKGLGRRDATVDFETDPVPVFRR